MFKSVIVTFAATTLLFAQSSSTIQFYDSLGVTKTARFGWQGAPTTGKFFIETPSDNAQNVTVDKGELTAKKVSGDGSGLTNVVPKDGSVTGEKIGVSAVDSTKINTNAVTTIKIKDGAVTNAKVADVDWAKITNKPSIPSEVIANGSVDSSKLAVGAVRPIHIRNNAIDSTKINSDAVTTSKIKDGAVTDAKVVTVDWAKISNKPSLVIAGNAIDTIIASRIKINPTTTGEETFFRIGNFSDPSPTQKIFDISQDASGQPYLALRVGGNGGSKGYQQILLNTNGNSFFNGGNVGIGTTTPAALLHVRGLDGLNASTRYLKCWVGGAVSWNPNASEELGVGFCGLRSTYVSGDEWRFGITTGTSGDFANGNQTEKLSILANGNVGIGTSNPIAPFHIYTGTDKNLFITSHANLSTGMRIGIPNNAGTANMGLEIDASTIFLNGNVGVGTTTPTSVLSVSGARNAFNVSGYWGGDGSADPVAKIVSTDLGVTESGTYFNIKNGATDFDLLNIKYTGTSLLKVHSGGTVTINNLCAMVSSCVSDRRFKLSLTPLDSSLSKITRLQGVYYLWDTKKFPERNFDTTKQIGLIAQDVEKIIPEVVHTAKDGYKSLSYDKLTAVLIEAVKEQQKQIELQQKQINDLRAEIKSIKK